MSTPGKGQKSIEGLLSFASWCSVTEARSAEAYGFDGFLELFRGM